MKWKKLGGSYGVPCVVKQNTDYNLRITIISHLNDTVIHQNFIIIFLIITLIVKLFIIIQLIRIVVFQFDYQSHNFIIILKLFLVI